MRNIRLTIEYDGTLYLGWQVQSLGRTIQGTIQEKLETMTGKRVHLIASGRTDAGVHAFRQVAHFRTESHLDVHAIRRGLNSLLPPDIVIYDAEESAEAFHSRRDAKSKVYEYRILNREVPSAFQYRYSWHIAQKLNLREMRKATLTLLGEHDFASFRSVGSPTRTSIRRIIRAEWKRGREGMILFEVEANGFLKQMVRALVGTLVEVGRGKIRAKDLREILDSKDRRRAGPTAPAEGLFLKEVKY